MKFGLEFKLEFGGCVVVIVVVVVVVVIAVLVVVLLRGRLVLPSGLCLWLGLAPELVLVDVDDPAEAAAVQPAELQDVEVDDPPEGLSWYKL